jgi:hypothetical protein
MSRRALVILLVVSAALNAGFLVGFLRTRALVDRLASPAGRLEYAFDRLRVEPERRTAARIAAQEWMQALRGIQDEEAARLEVVWSEVAKPGSDPDRLRALVQEPLDANRRGAELSMEYLRRVCACLTPDQSQALIAMMRESRKY